MHELTEHQKQKLIDSIDDWLPVCSLCNDAGEWSNGMPCVCEYDAWQVEVSPYATVKGYFIIDCWGDELGQGNHD